jgi:3-oxoacyl-[acyl-carrier protein] reductase
MNLNIQNKYFLVTGASRGIGRAIAESLLSEGANVGLVARGQVQLEQTVDELRQQFEEERVVGWPIDCAEKFSLLELRQQITRLWAHLDGVIVNVGDGRSVPDAIPDAEQWSQVWQTNFETALNTARVFLPLLQESRGNLLFISSIAGLEAIGAPVDYSTAKTAVIAFAKNLARKVALEVRVNVIAPGNVHFPGSSWEEKIETDSKNIEQMLQDKVPMKRFGTPQEIADAATFLCSARASFITGSVMVVDGGQTVSLL